MAVIIASGAWMRRFRAAAAFALAAGLCATVRLPAGAQVSVLTQHNDNSRTGANLKETALTAKNVDVTRFGKLFTRDVDGEVYAQPLYVPNLMIGRVKHNVVFVATMNNSIYAFDGDDPAQSAPLWSKNYGPPINAWEVQCCCNDISTKIGILSTPVIDAQTGTMYLLNRSKTSNGQYHQYLHALNIANGAEKFGGPVEISATYSYGNNQTDTFDPKIQNQRPALLLSNGQIYIGWASHNDCGGYHGWLMSYNATTLEQTGVFNTTPGGWASGIWMGGQGPTTDADGNVYVETGNGTFNSNGTQLSCSFIKFAPNAEGGFAKTDWFTPSNVDDLNAADDDVGCGGILNLPNSNVIVGSSKRGLVYVLNRGNLGHFRANGDSQIVQEFRAANGHIHGSPVYYNSAALGSCIYLWSEYDTLKVYAFNGNTFNPTPVAASPMRVPDGMPGAMLSISANGNAPGSALVWASHPLRDNANQSVVEGIFRVFDATSVTKGADGKPRLTELWNSKEYAARDDIGLFAKFCPPTIANGKVYMANFGAVGAPTGSSGHLVVYGLLARQTAPAPPTLTGQAFITESRLKWTATKTAIRYNLYRSQTPGGEGASPYKAGLTTLTYNDLGLTTGGTYYYQVTAINSVGESDKSNEVQVTPIQPTNLLGPVGDATVQSGTLGGMNFGSTPQLSVMSAGSSFTRYAYIRFELSNVRGTVSQVVLRLYGARKSNSVVTPDSVYGVANSNWNELGINWYNKPALGDKLATTAITQDAKYYEWDVTAFVKAQKDAGKRFVTLAVQTDAVAPNSLGDLFNSREAANLRPQLGVFAQ